MKKEETSYITTKISPASHSSIYGMNKHLLFLLLTFFLNIVLILVMLAVKIKTPYHKTLLPPVFDLLLTLPLVYTILYLVDFIITSFTNRFKKQPNSFKRYFLEIAVVGFTGYFVLKAFTDMYLWIYSLYDPNTAAILPQVRFSGIIFINFLMIIYAFMRGFHYFVSLRLKELELIQWQKDVSQSHFESLKNQLNPHFLFNSFSILISLIYKDANEADVFINKLSKAYRYLLDQRDKEVIPLAAELQFLKNYDFILSKRFGNKITLEYPDSLTSGYDVIPYTLILTLDHLIASHKMSALQPLKIMITITDGVLCVAHRYAPKTNQYVNEQLLILQERYEQLTGQPIKITKQEGLQHICFPLISVSHANAPAI